MSAEITQAVAYAVSSVGFLIVGVGIIAFALWVVAGTIALLGWRR